MCTPRWSRPGRSSDGGAAAGVDRRGLRLPPESGVRSWRGHRLRAAVDQDGFLWALHYMAAHLPPEPVPETAAAVRSCCRAVCRPCPGPPGPAAAAGRARAAHGRSASGFTQAIEDQPERASVVSRLASHLNGKRRNSLLEAAWRIVRSISNEFSQSSQFETLIRYPPPEAIQAEMLAALQGARNKRSETLAAIAPYLAAELLPRQSKSPTAWTSVPAGGTDAAGVGPPDGGRAGAGAVPRGAGGSERSDFRHSRYPTC